MTIAIKKYSDTFLDIPPLHADSFFYLRHVPSNIDGDAKRTTISPSCQPPKGASHRVGVLAFRYVAPNALRIAGSLCVPTDQWNPKTGVNKAMGKLNSKSYSRELVIPTPQEIESPPKELASMILRSLFERTQWHWEKVVDIDKAQTMLEGRLRHMLLPKPQR